MCKALSSLRDQARLNSIASPPAGAWLQTIPNPNLGLAMPQHEVHRSHKDVARDSPFPPSPHSLLCTCGQTIDHFGDHLMGCGHGPLRIMRHKALRDTIWHALLQDNNNAVRKQHCGEGNSRPGDVYHPNFQQGKPAYFDISVRSSLQPQYLNMQVQQGRPARLRRILAMPSKWKKQGDYFSLLLLSPWAYGPPPACESSSRLPRRLPLWATSPGHKPSVTSYNNCPCAYGRTMRS